MCDDQRRYVANLQQRERRLPHWEAPGETYFVTFCLRRPPAVDLSEPQYAWLVCAALSHFDGTRYVLFDFVVMPDHVHAIMKPVVRDGRCEALSAIMQSLKGWLARQINLRAARKGPLWQDEAYDHIIRDTSDYERKASYILDNPRRQGLVECATDWPWWGTGSGVV